VVNLKSCFRQRYYMGLLQCTVAVPYPEFCPDDDAERMAVEECEVMKGNSFAQCLPLVGQLFDNPLNGGSVKTRTKTIQSRT